MDVVQVCSSPGLSLPSSDFSVASSVSLLGVESTLQSQLLSLPPPSLVRPSDARSAQGSPAFQTQSADPPHAEKVSVCLSLTLLRRSCFSIRVVGKESFNWGGREDLHWQEGREGAWYLPYMYMLRPGREGGRVSRRGKRRRVSGVGGVV